MVHCRRDVFMQSWCSRCQWRKKRKQIKRHCFLFPHFVFAVCSQLMFALARVFASHLPTHCWFFIWLFVTVRPPPRDPPLSTSPVAVGCCRSALATDPCSIAAYKDVLRLGKEPLFLETAISRARVAEEWKQEGDKRVFYTYVVSVLPSTGSSLYSLCLL